MLHPQIGAVGMRGADGEHRGVGPSSRSFRRERRGNRRTSSDQRVHLIWPAARSDDAFSLEVVSLDRRILPIAADERTLTLQQLDRGRVLSIVQLIGVLDTELRLVRLEVKRRIGNVD